jgi:hypothetical protein
MPIAARMQAMGASVSIRRTITPAKYLRKRGRGARG